MSNKTSDDYLREVKAWYLQRRYELHAGVMAEPTGANLRDLCLTLLRIGLTTSDEEVFTHYFKAGRKEDLERAIARSDGENFRPIINFLKGSSQSTDVKNLNLIAVLIDFPHRPLPNFRKNFKESHRLEFEPGHNQVSDNDEKHSEKSKTKVYWLIGLIILLTVVILTVANRPLESCMVWKGDHYISINCQDSTFDQTAKEPLDSKQFQLNKIPVSKNTVFFVDGKPQVWYLKHENRHQFFDQPGYHPIKKEKTLRPVTTYIAMQVFDGTIVGE